MITDKRVRSSIGVEKKKEEKKIENEKQMKYNRNEISHQRNKKLINTTMEKVGTDGEERIGRFSTGGAKKLSRNKT